MEQNRKSFETYCSYLGELAEQEAKRLGHNRVVTEHFLLALMTSKEMPASKLLQDCLSSDYLTEIRSTIESMITDSPYQLTMQTTAETIRPVYMSAYKNYVKHRRLGLHPSIHLLNALAEVGGCSGLLLIHSERLRIGAIKYSLQ